MFSTFVLAATVVGFAAADDFIFYSPACNTNAANKWNYATDATMQTMDASNASSIAMSLLFSDQYGNVSATDDVMPVSIHFAKGEYYVGEIEIPAGTDLELDAMAEIYFDDSAIGESALYTAGQYVKPACDVSCMNNWRTYETSTENPDTNPQTTDMIDYSVLPAATRVPCVSDIA